VLRPETEAWGCTVETVKRRSPSPAPPYRMTRFETTLSSGHRIYLRLGDIADEAVDAIVNAANVGLVLGGGVAGAILRKGGLTIQDECDRLGKVPTGGAAMTHAGRLPAQFVIHAVGPVWRGNTADENDRLLGLVTIAALEIARTRGLRRIAFPAISSGIFGFPKDRCARVMVGAVIGWATEHPTDDPREVRFTIIDEQTVALFEAELRSRFAEGGPNWP
jgi:O-acetyl-ADP-ribose deacetylase